MIDFSKATDPVADAANAAESAAALAYLKATDWYVTRNTETGVAIPPEVTEARAAARLKA